MILNFIFVHLNAFILVFWIIFSFIIAFRFFSPLWVKSNNHFISKIIERVRNISYKKLIFITIGINILLGIFLTWGQYHVWATATNYTKMFVKLPLPSAVPIVSYLEWTRHLFFENHLGYFLYYAWGHFWLNIFISFILSSALYFIFKFWESKRGSFDEHGPELFLILSLISGWPGILAFISLGFIFVILFSAYSNFRGVKIVKIEPAFMLLALLLYLLLVFL